MVTVKYNSLSVSLYGCYRNQKTRLKFVDYKDGDTNENKKSDLHEKVQHISLEHLFLTTFIPSTNEIFENKAFGSIYLNNYITLNL